MRITAEEAPRIASQVMILRVEEQRRLTKIARYMSGRHDPVYAPKGASSEYRWIMKIARENFLPLVVSGISQNLHIDGYRRSDDPETSENESKELGLGGNITRPGVNDDESGWQAFKVNRMVSRQHGVHRSVLTYGAAYCLVLPADLATEYDSEQPVKTAIIRPCSPRRMTALYADLADEWPQLAIETYVMWDASRPGKGQRIVALYDESSRYMLAAPAEVQNPTFTLMTEDNPLLTGPAIAEHSLGICPVVRFLHNDDLDGENDVAGEVEPLIHIQDQINFGTFNLLMTQQYAAFRQRWVTGMQAVVNEDGKQVAPFNPGVDRVWAAEGADTKFGEFGQSGLRDDIESREASIRHMATMAQVPPYQLLGALVNLSADALAAARDGLDRKVSELQGLLTDSWRNVFRLSSKASGDKVGWADINSSVIWRDTSAKSFAATVDALGKAAQLLGIPVTELWRRIPGATADDVNAWVKVATEKNALGELNDLVNATLTGDLSPQNPSSDMPYQLGSIGVRRAAGYGRPSIAPPGPGDPGSKLPPLPPAPGTPAAEAAKSSPAPSARPRKKPGGVPGQGKKRPGAAPHSTPEGKV